MPFLKIPSFDLADDYLFRLCDDLVYQSDLVSFEIVVPKGFETDFASIPRLLRFIYPVNGRHRCAAVVHDYLYYKAGRIVVDGTAISYTRKQADLIFLEAMKSLGVRWTQRKSMYRGVRLGGWKHWIFN